MFKKILIASSSFLIALMIASVLYIDDSHFTFKTKNERIYNLLLFRTHQIISDTLINNLDKIILSPYQVNEEQRTIYVLTEGFKKLNKLANATKTNWNSMCMPTHKVKALLKNSDTLHLAVLDCSGEEYDIWEVGYDRYTISKEMMNFIETNSKQSHYTKLDILERRLAIDWYQNNNANLETFTLDQKKIDYDLEGVLNPKDSLLLDSLGCSIFDSKVRFSNKKAPKLYFFQCRQNATSILDNLNIDFKSFQNDTLEIWYIKENLNFVELKD